MIWFICNANVLFLGHALRIYSPDAFGNHPIWISIDHVTGKSFKVKSCGGAHIYLSAYYAVTTKDSYEIVIGAEGNTK